MDTRGRLKSPTEVRFPILDMTSLKLLLRTTSRELSRMIRMDCIPAILMGYVFVYPPTSDIITDITCAIIALAKVFDSA